MNQIKNKNKKRKEKEQINLIMANAHPNLKKEKKEKKIVASFSINIGGVQIYNFQQFKKLLYLF